MPIPTKPPVAGLLTPARFDRPPGPPLALGAALGIWLFAQAELTATLLALLVAALVGAGYLKARRTAAVAEAALAAAEERIAKLEALHNVATPAVMEAATIELEEIRNRLGAA